MTVHRLRSWRWYPHDWLRFALPWTSKANARRILDSVKPDVVHFQSHIVVGRGLARRGAEARHPHRRHEPRDAREHRRVHAPSEVPRKTFVDVGVGRRGKSFDRAESVTTPTRKAAEFLESRDRPARRPRRLLRHRRAQLHAGLHPAHRQHHPLRRPDHGREAHRRAAQRREAAAREPGCAPPDRRRRRPVQEPPGDGRDPRHRRPRRLPRLRERRGAAPAYTRATVFAMPSIAELQSIATMEAMASGLPVVAADAMALPHLVHDGENGHLFRPGDAKTSRTSWRASSRCPRTSSMCSSGASLRIVATHDIQTTISTFESLYRGEPVADPVTDAAPRARSGVTRAHTGR